MTSGEFFRVDFMAKRSPAQERQRADIQDQYKWILADVYPSVQAWQAAKDAIASDIPKLKAFQGKLGLSAATLADALDATFALDKELSRVYVYASMLADEDTRDSTHEVQTGDKQAIDRYLRFLSAGGSKYPIDLLKDAGVDMTTDEPLDLTIKEMNRVMDEMEKLL